MPGRNPIDEGYIEVNKRIEKFYEKYPLGSLQSEVTHFDYDPETKVGFVVVKATAYRGPEGDDPHPGVGHSMLTIPGKTPFTQGSELENAETSAWGRALAALGFEVKKAIASADEVAMKRNFDLPPEQGAALEALNGSSAQPERTATAAQLRKIHAKANEINVTTEELGILRAVLTDKKSASDFTFTDVDTMLNALASREAFEQIITSQPGIPE